jgi:hypothetical protein
VGECGAGGSLFTIYDLKILDFNWCCSAYNAKAMTRQFGGHSAQVEMRLLVNGSSIRIAQLCPDFLLLDEPIDYPSGGAIIIMRVDQNERSWSVQLPGGIPLSSKRVPISPVTKN